MEINMFKLNTMRRHQKAQRPRNSVFPPHPSPAPLPPHHPKQSDNNHWAVSADPDQSDADCQH